MSWSQFLFNNHTMITSIIIGAGMAFFAYGSFAMSRPQMFVGPHTTYTKKQVINCGLFTSLFGSAILTVGCYIVGLYGK